MYSWWSLLRLQHVEEVKSILWAPVQNRVPLVDQLFRTKIADVSESHVTVSANETIGGQSGTRKHAPSRVFTRRKTVANDVEAEERAGRPNQTYIRIATDYILPRCSKNLIHERGVEHLYLALHGETWQRHRYSSFISSLSFKSRWLPRFLATPAFLSLHQQPTCSATTTIDCSRSLRGCCVS